MTEIGALLIDMDGTLVDTADANYAAYAAALAEEGVTVSRVEFDQAAWARRWREFLPELLGNTHVDPETVARRKQALYPAMVGRTRVNGHVLALAQTIGRSCPCALVTTASARSVETVLAYHHLTGLFDAVVTGDDVIDAKPAPEAYLLAARRLGVAPEACWVVEDSDVGIESARRAGMAVFRIESACFTD